jgi:hypothetical protein
MAPTHPLPDVGSDRASLAMAILAAVFHRQRTGEGQWVDRSCTETAMTLTGTDILDHTANGRPPRPVGSVHSNRDPSGTMAPHGIYPAEGEDQLQHWGIWPSVTHPAMGRVPARGLRRPLHPGRGVGASRRIPPGAGRHPRGGTAATPGRPDRAPGTEGPSSDLHRVGGRAERLLCHCGLLLAVLAEHRPLVGPVPWAATGTRCGSRRMPGKWRAAR